MLLTFAFVAKIIIMNQIVVSLYVFCRRRRVNCLQFFNFRNVIDIEYNV